MTVKEMNKLSADLSAAQSTIDKLQAERDALQRRVDWLEKQIFGQKSEKTTVVLDANSEQLGLFNETEVECTSPTAVNIPAHSRKAKRTRKETYENLPVEEIVHHAEDPSCDTCGVEMVVIGKEFVRDEVIFSPARLFLRKHYVETLKCPQCGTDESQDASLPEVAPCVFKKAAAPKPLISYSPVSPELLAHVIYEKYKKAVPLYRLESDFKAMGYPLSRATMANWINWAATEKFSAVYECMKKDLLSGTVIHADETPVQVLKEPGRKATNTSRMWVYCAGKASGKHNVVFEYQPTRGGYHAAQFLDGFHGYLMTDDFSGYNRTKDVRRCLCWAHTRRYFIKALPKDTELLQSSQAAVGVQWCNKIFELDREFADQPADERLKHRQETVKPVLDEFFAWANALEVAAGSDLAKAIGYLLTNKALLYTFLEDADAPLDNNRAESAIRPFVVGRKNWLFSDSVKGAKASATIYSIVSTAAANGLNVEQYIAQLLTAEKPLLPW